MIKRKGFEISLDNERNILTTRAWGVWDVDLARKFGHTLQEKIKEIRPTANVWYGVTDFTDFSPLSDAVEEMIGKQFLKPDYHSIHWLSV
jgi:hypothetical protein